MMLSMARLRDRMATRFSDVEQVEESVIRFTRRLNDRPFAVCYVDISPNLPSTPEALSSYQDRVLGKRYFDGRKSLQWSNYLYFIVADERATTTAVCKAKELIEQDRTYARKFVVTADELDSALQPPTLGPGDALPETNILSVWVSKLTEAGLDGAVLTDGTLPSRLTLIEQSSTPYGPNVTVPVVLTTGIKAPFLRSIQLTGFRDFPVQRLFSFGTVNLIFGVNGSGKTSLLEAIELLYCGRTKRNPDATDAYTIAATFEDSSSDTATRSRPLKVFRERNLAWYGQAEVKTNNLFLSFAQFNFLDTDAAVSLADSTDRIQEDLAKLLVGPQASKTWREIQRIDEAIAAKLRELRPLQDHMKEELATIDARVTEAGTVRQESDSIFTRLEEMVRRTGWAMPPGEKEDVAGKLVESLSELDSLARQAASFEWAGSPVSLDGLSKYSDDVEKLCEKVEPDMARLDSLRRDEKRVADAKRRCQEALQLVAAAARLADAGILTRAVELRKQQAAVTADGAVLAGCEEDILAVLRKSPQGISVAEYVRATESERAAADNALASAKEEHTKFTVLREHSLKLAQELREIATQLLLGSPNPDKCPLCHTQFGEGQLAEHMQKGVDAHVEARAQTLLSRVRQCEAGVRAAAVAAVAAGWLAKFCERARFAVTDSVRSAQSRVEATQKAREDAQRRADTLKKELQTLEAHDLSVAKMDELGAALSEAGYPLADWTKEELERLRARVEQEGSLASKALEEQRKTAADLHQAIETALAATHPDVDHLKSAVSQLKERRTVADGLRKKLCDTFQSLFWRSDRPLSELAVEADLVRKVAAECQAARTKERQARAVLAEASKRKAELTERLTALEPRIHRFTRAQAALESIQKEHSLTGAMEAALKRNRSAIEAIFGRIHAPAEFSGLGKQLTTLIRKTGGKETTLSEISAGQRAAFALSIFLAQNAQLRTAPPVLLIDDPIAHVDDLNSLSFLDYLREVVLAGGRQIMFATANERLATLFERKFDFLGDREFRRFDLRR